MIETEIKTYLDRFPYVDAGEIVRHRVLLQKALAEIRRLRGVEIELTELRSSIEAPDMLYDRSSGRRLDGVS